MNIHLAVTAHLPNEREVLQMVIWKESWKQRSCKHWILRERSESTPYAESGFLLQKGEEK